VWARLGNNLDLIGMRFAARTHDYEYEKEMRRRVFAIIGGIREAL
jgi:hypothetical protein